jgi:integrase
LKDYKPATVKNILVIIQRIINHGNKKQLCPSLDFKTEMPKVDNEKKDALKPDELKRLFETLELEEFRDSMVSHLVKFALFTGMKKGELFELQWSDINFDDLIIALRNTKSGKNNTIPLNETAKKVLNTIPRSDSPYIFPGRFGGKRDNIKKQINKVKMLAELPKDFRSLHGLRSTFATISASSGKVDIYMLQTLMTHQSPVMTQRYADLIDKARLESSNIIAEAIDKIVAQ